MSEDRVREDLETLAASYQTGSAPLDRLLKQAHERRRRSRRRQVALVCAAFVLIAGVGAVTSRVVGGDDDRTLRPAPPGVPACAGPRSSDELGRQPSDLPSGATSARICPTFLWRARVPDVVITRDLGSLVSRTEEAYGRGRRTGSKVACPDVGRPTYLLQLSYPNGALRFVHLTDADPPCDHIQIGGQRSTSGAHGVLDYFNQLAREQTGRVLPLGHG